MCKNCKLVHRQISIQTISFIKCIIILRQAQLSGGEAEHTAVAPAACSYVSALQVSR